MRFSPHVSVLAILMAPLFGCGCHGGDGHSQATVRDSAGVRIVEMAPAALERDVGWSVGLEPVLSLGVQDRPAAEAFTRVRTAFRLSDGRVVVQGGGDPAIAVFSVGGAFLHGIGRRGEGPEEWRRLGTVGHIGGDTLVVHDVSSAALIWFDSDGRFLRRVPLGAPPRDLFAAPMGNPAYLGPEGAAVQMLPAEPRNNERASVPYVLFDARTGAATELAEVAGPVWSVGRRETSGGSSIVEEGILDPRWRSYPEATGGSGRFLTADGVGFEVREWSLEGKGLMAEYRLEGQAEQPDSPPSLGPILLDEAGYVWVDEYEAPGQSPPDRVRYWIIDPNGAVLGHVGLPGSFRLVHVSRNEVFAEVRDTLDVPRLLVLPLTRQ